MAQVKTMNESRITMERTMKAMIFFSRKLRRGANRFSQMMLVGSGAISNSKGESCHFAGC